MTSSTVHLEHPILDLAPVQAESVDLVVLDDQGSLIGVDLRTGRQRPLGRIQLPEVGEGRPGGFPPERARLHVSGDGSIAAVVHDAGRTGAVMQLPAGGVAMRLETDAYHPDTVPFSLAFVRHGGRWRVVHRTAWNRLDVSDAVTGELLTVRESPVFQRQPAADHYLEYFHGGLVVSPSGEWIADGGWVWHPVGVLRTWSMREWLDRDVWASEDGTSLREPVFSDDWDLPMCWLTDDRLVMACDGVWDMEEFEETAAPHLRVIRPDADHDHQIPVAARPTALFTDGRIVLGQSEGTTTAWDPDSGDQLWHWPDFATAAVGAGRAIAVNGSTLRVRPLP